MANQNALRQEINQKIIEALENDTIPWRRPWSLSPDAGRHRNFTTDHVYSGVNPLLLEMHNLKHGLCSIRWATFNQWKAAGCTVNRRPDHVRPGEWGCKIIFYKPVTKTTVVDGKEEEDEFMVMRAYTVFNADQVEGLSVEQLAHPSHQDEANCHEAADQLIAATKADVRHGDGDKAFYRRPIPEASWPDHFDGDFIMLPPRQRFLSDAAYCETVLHELSHWSEIRLQWDHDEHGYAMGELIAELASCYVASELRIPSGELTNHARYLKAWLKEMRESPSFIFKAATQASKVADYLLSFRDKTENRELADAVA